ncbi:hypothetical protein SAMN05216289_1457 [Dokdonella immobilis]|uniref:HipA-like C-terminal domain-containing protein n=1 Tax=Dokdonella immobilis TaxID=578942 RepID=A0A1I5AX95_9GAMM|nr:hypothetical protein SAMN05216289_1457 [Dokdonella immobilis]
MNQQPTLIPVDIQRTEPAPFGSADCTHYGIGFDGLPYILKRVENHNPLMPVAELLCSRMAAASQVPCATGHIANLPNGEQAFGSRAESGVLSPRHAAARLTTDATLLLKVAGTLSTIFAFDVFVRNVDRHFGNYLVRQTFAGPDLMAVDHSRALVVTGWPAKKIDLPKDCNTLLCQVVLRKKQALTQADAVAAIDRLLQLDDDWLSRNICDVPVAWWPTPQRQIVDRWWRRHRTKRLGRIRRRLINANL